MQLVHFLLQSPSSIHPLPSSSQVNASIPSSLNSSPSYNIAMIRNSSRPGLRRWVYTLTSLLALLAVLLSITTMSRFYSQPSLFITNPFSNTHISDSSQIIDTIIQKIIEEIKSNESNMNKESLAFLTDILSLMGTLKSSTPPQQRNSHSQSAEVAAAHPLSNNYNEAIDFFLVEEIRKYITIKPNRLKKQNFMGANGTFTSVGHACFSMKRELEEYMDYDVGDLCKDDWKQAQRLMVHGCDPLPRRRCLSRAPKLYTAPLPITQSLWSLPDDRNVRWSQYRCKNFACLARNTTGKGFFKCSDCFNLTHHEMPRWIETDPDSNLNKTADFTVKEVLGIKDGGIRIGLDFSAGTGSFAARMRELDVTVVTATINLGAPFSEMIALRGLVPLYLTINQRLPFFDNTLDMIHTTRFLDGWIDFMLLDFVLYDWDRVLRPGGLLWIDSFFCLRRDLDDYLETFGRLRYKRHRWVVVPKVDKDGKEVFFSAVLEKPPRPF